MTPDQKRVFDEIKSGPRGRVQGPLRVWLQSPALAEHAQALGRFVRYDSSLAPELSELAILVTARIWGSGFEWSTHAPIAEQAGLEARVIEKIASGIRPDFSNPLQAAVFDFAVETHKDRGVSDKPFSKARDLLGITGVVDLVGICGYYSLISMTINAFQVPSESGPDLPVLETSPEDMFR